jgi:hypothetical protein
MISTLSRVVLLGAGVLLLPLIEQQQWHGNTKWVLIPDAAASLAAFVWWERRRGQPPAAGGPVVVQAGFLHLQGGHLPAVLRRRRPREAPPPALRPSHQTAGRGALDRRLQPSYVTL